VPELHRLHTDHAPAVLAFGPTNRAYFSDPGDEFYDQFTERRSALLAEQAVDIGAFYFRALDGSVLVWFIDFDNGHACSGHH
jgi:ribosomal-protein-alanine N-acetyltransferase